MSFPANTISAKGETVIASEPTPIQTHAPDSECKCVCCGCELICKSNCCSDCVADCKSDCESESMACKSCWSKNY